MKVVVWIVATLAAIGLIGALLPSSGGSSDDSTAVSSTEAPLQPASSEVPLEMPPSDAELLRRWGRTYSSQIAAFLDNTQSLVQAAESSLQRGERASLLRLCQQAFDYSSPLKSTEKWWNDSPLTDAGELFRRTYNGYVWAWVLCIEEDYEAFVAQIAKAATDLRAFSEILDDATR